MATVESKIISPAARKTMAAMRLLTVVNGYAMRLWKSLYKQWRLYNKSFHKNQPNEN